MQSRAHHTHIAYWHSILLALLFGLVVAYVWQINNQAQHSFSIRDLEQERTELAGEIRDLNWQLSSVRSLANIALRAEHLALEAPLEVVYLDMGFSTVAAYDSISP